MPPQRRLPTSYDGSGTLALSQARKSARLASLRATERSSTTCQPNSTTKPSTTTSRSNIKKNHFIVASDLGTTSHITAYKRVDPDLPLSESGPIKYVRSYPHGREGSGFAEQVPTVSWYAIRRKDRGVRMDDRSLTAPPPFNDLDIDELSQFGQSLLTGQTVTTPDGLNDAIHEGYLTGHQVQNQVISNDN
jgi:hypothetical protein